MFCCCLQRPAPLLKWAPTTAVAPAPLCWAGPRVWAERASVCAWRRAVTRTPAAQHKPTAPSIRWGVEVFIMSLWIQFLDTATAATQLTCNCRQVNTHKRKSSSDHLPLPCFTFILLFTCFLRLLAPKPVIYLFITILHSLFSPVLYV